jgi:transposase
MAHRTDSSHTESVFTTVQLPMTLGLDLSDQESTFHLLRGDGATLEIGKVANKKPALSKLFERFRGCRLVLETGTQSSWIAKLGTSCGMDVLVANSRRVALISKSDRKTDRSDAHLLAEMGRTNPGLLSPVTPRSDEAQIGLCVLRARDAAVTMRTSLVNHVRAVLKTHGLRAPSSSPEAFVKKAASSIPAHLAAGLGPLMALIEASTREIARLDKEIEQLCTEHPATALLRQIGGVGPVVSLTFVLTLDDPARFKSGRDVGAFVGLVPRKKSSGDSDPQLRITKAGDRQLRRLLVIAANYILGCHGPDCDLRRFGSRLAGDGNDRIDKKKARVAVARKLAVLMHHLWRSGEVYDPLYLAKKRGELAVA